MGFSFLTVVSKESAWQPVIISYPTILENGVLKHSITQVEMGPAQTDHKVAEKAAGILSQTMGFTFVPKEAKVISVAAMFDCFLPFELNAQMGMAKARGMTAESIDEAIAQAKKFASEENLQFIAPARPNLIKRD